MRSIYSRNAAGSTSTSSRVDGIVCCDILEHIYATEMHEKSYRGQCIECLPKLNIRPIVSHSY
jgi:hypothetical protein